MASLLRFWAMLLVNVLSRLMGNSHCERQRSNPAREIALGYCSRNDNFLSVFAIDRKEEAFVMEKKTLNCNDHEVLMSLLDYLIRHRNAKDTLEGYTRMVVSQRLYCAKR